MENNELKLTDQQMDELILDVVTNLSNEVDSNDIKRLKNLWIKKGYGYKKIDIANEEMIQLINLMHFKEQEIWLNNPILELQLEKKLSEIMNLYNKAYEEK